MTEQEAQAVGHKLFTAEGLIFDSTEDHDRYLWDQRVRAERKRQVAKGYTAEHDAEAGVDHLLVWAAEYARRGEPVKCAALIEAARALVAEWERSRLSSRVVEAAPSDTDARAEAFAEAERRWPDPFVGRLAAIEDFAAGAEWWASRSPEAAGSDTDRAALIVRIQREMESYDPETLGDDPAMFDSWNLLHDARAALVVSQPVQAKPLWETKPDGRIGPTEHGLKVWNESQPVQVEVTEDMVERMARSLFAQTTEASSGFSWPINGDWGRERDMKRARDILVRVLGLSAALDGGE